MERPTITLDELRVALTEIENDLDLAGYVAQWQESHPEEADEDGDWARLIEFARLHVSDLAPAPPEHVLESAPVG